MYPKTIKKGKEVQPFPTMIQVRRRVDLETGEVIEIESARFIQSPRDAEENAAQRMRELGYRDAEATPPGIDGGIDVRSSRALAQVKCRAQSAGRPDLQRLLGARGSPHGGEHKKELWFFASSGFTKGAVKYADLHHILLFTYAAIGQIEPRNKLAEEKINSFRAKRKKKRLSLVR